MKKNKTIKEERVMRDDPSLKNPFFDDMKDLNPHDTGRGDREIDKFDTRAKIYWEELFGLMDVLNANNSKITITSPDSPYILQYLIWRLLNEIKLTREDDKVDRINKEKIRNKLDL